LCVCVCVIVWDLETATVRCLRPDLNCCATEPESASPARFYRHVCRVRILKAVIYCNVTFDRPLLGIGKDFLLLGQ
jgi:hypothetical protein